MKRSDQAYLLATARQLADQLKLSDGGSAFRIRRPARTSVPESDGWRTVIGDLGTNQPRLELWLDRFSGFSERKFWACFFSEDRRRITKITKRVSRTLWPVRTITLKEIRAGKFFALDGRLKASELAKPILEKYQSETFFGIYDPAPKNSDKNAARFRDRAAAFFVQVAESMPRAKGRPIARHDYPHCENRKLVKAHLRRERSAFLAVQCKQRDDHRCRICGMKFSEDYGKPLGEFFAEAHHIRPLAELGDKVKTNVEDLITVCSNCHRMLHRMEGGPRDVSRLRSIYKKRSG